MSITKMLPICPPATRCVADIPPEDNPDVVYNVAEGNNSGCIHMKAKMQLSVPYHRKDNVTFIISLFILK